MIHPGDLLSLAVQNLSLHKVRSALTSLGVIFGVGSVIAMLAIAEGAKRKALEQIEAMGINKIIVFTREPTQEGQDASRQQQQRYEKFGLTEDDLENMRKMDNVDRVTAGWMVRKPIYKGLTRLDLKLVGVDYEFLEDSGSDLEQGRWLTPADFANDRKVCVLGTNAKRKFFSLSRDSVLGNSVKIDNQVYTVVGILNNTIGTQYSELGSPNDMILTPLNVVRGLGMAGGVRQSRQPDYDLFVLRVENVEYIDNTASRLEAYFDKAHGSVNDWGIVVPLELLKQSEATQNIFTIVMGSIAGISLIVGGIGIMNIMLAGVYERRKEIGTRRALGAQKSDILMQFLLETVFLTTLGGIFGVGVGFGLAKIIATYAEMPVIFTWWSIAMSLVIAGFVGIVFGTYPAWKAAQQNPIDVLRSE